MQKITKAHPFRLLPLLFAAVLLGGCASGMRSYYADLETKIALGDYAGAAEFVEKSKKKYGKNDILMYYLDSGMVNHLAENYKESTKKFEAAKDKYDEYYQKSVTAGAASMLFNDSTMPYYGENYERVHINVFEAVNFLEESDAASAAVEARQADNMFRIFEVDGSYKKFYKDDGFIRYFMGLVYENAGELNDAHVSFYLALKAYKDGISGVQPPADLVNDAYTTALMLGMPLRAEEIKEDYPEAEKTFIPQGLGELIIIDYNGTIPRKEDNILEFALADIIPYINQVDVTLEEHADFEIAKSIPIAAFANDYIKIAFPKYHRIPNKIKSFSINYGENSETDSYEAQNLAEIAEKCLEDNIVKVYAKTLARAAVKYAVGKAVSKTVEDSTGGKGWGSLTQAGFNIFNAVTAVSDKRGWRTLPENILMARTYLPAGENNITVEYFDVNGRKLKSEDFTVNIESGRKTFKILRSLM